MEQSRVVRRNLWLQPLQARLRAAVEQAPIRRPTHPAARAHCPAAAFRSVNLPVSKRAVSSSFVRTASCIVRSPPSVGLGPRAVAALRRRTPRRQPAHRTSEIPTPRAAVTTATVLRAAPASAMEQPSCSICRPAKTPRDSACWRCARAMRTARRIRIARSETWTSSAKRTRALLVCRPTTSAPRTRTAS